MEYRKYTAKTIGEAITKACLDLGVTSDRLDYQVTQEPTNGFLGIGSKPAIIEAREKAEEKVETAPVQKEETKKVTAEPVVQKAEPKKTIVTSDEIEKRAALAAAKAKEEGRTEEEAPKKERRERRDRLDRRRSNDRRRHSEAPKHEPSKPKPERVVTPKSEEEVQELTKAAEEFLKGVFGAMNIEVQMTVEYHQTEGSLNISFAGEEMGILIGKRGQTLDSLQYLTSLVVNKGKSEYTRVKLDTEDYRTRRAETLHNLARNIAFKVRKTRRPVSLEPMNPYERRIIHSALQNNKFVETYSEGEEPYRHVVVTPKH